MTITSSKFGEWSRVLRHDKIANIAWETGRKRKMKNICEIKKKNVANYRHWRFLSIDKTRSSFFCLITYLWCLLCGWIDQQFWTQNGVARWKQKVVLRFAFVFFLFILFWFSSGVCFLSPRYSGVLDMAAIRRRQERRRWINHLFVGEWLACLHGKCERCNNISLRKSPLTHDLHRLLPH